MSPRAAWRLDRMGFEVYDYVGGKADWIGAGWESERAASSPRRALDVIDRDPPTCAPGDTVERLTTLVTDQAGVFVVNEERVVLGRVGHDELQDAAQDATAESIMQPGPTTVRANEELEGLLHRMGHFNVTEMAVTTAEGELLGVVRADAG